MPAGAAMLIEQDDTVTNWFARHDASLVLMRPDHHVYGVASDSAASNQLVQAFNPALRTER